MTNIRQFGLLQLAFGIALFIFYIWLLLTDSMSSSESIFGYIGNLMLPAVLLCLIITGAYAFFYLEIFNWRIKKLRSSGVKTTLKINKIIYKTIGYQFSGHNRLRAFSIVATGMNPLTKKEQNFKSKPMSIYMLKNKKVNTEIGSDIDVYIYKKNPNKYLVDIRECLK